MCATVGTGTTGWRAATPPDGEKWFYGYDPFGRRLTKVRRLSGPELSWTAQRFPGLVPPSARGGTQLWTWPAAPAGSGGAGDGRPPVVGVQFTWDGDVVAEEAPLRLDGSSDWDRATRWHFEPGGFVPLAKQTAGGALLPIVTDHLGTPREMFDEAGILRWAASYTTWGVVRGVRGPALEADNDDRKAIYPRAGRLIGTDGNLALVSTPDDTARNLPIRFQGQWADDETGLAYSRYRHYDALAGQYASPDPIRLAGGFRLHGYVPNPRASIDPLGLTHKLGDLTPEEIKKIQQSADQAERPISVVGSAARGTRRNPGSGLPIGKGPGTQSDIDYIAPPNSIPYFDGQPLPNADPKVPIIPGYPNPDIGPSIRFEPDASPTSIPAR